MYDNLTRQKNMSTASLDDSLSNDSPEGVPSVFDKADGSVTCLKHDCPDSDGMRDNTQRSGTQARVQVAYPEESPILVKRLRMCRRSASGSRLLIVVDGNNPNVFFTVLKARMDDPDRPLHILLSMQHVNFDHIPAPTAPAPSAAVVSSEALIKVDDKTWPNERHIQQNEEQNEALGLKTNFQTELKPTNTVADKTNSILHSETVDNPSLSQLPQTAFDGQCLMDPAVILHETSAQPSPVSQINEEGIEAINTHDDLLYARVFYLAMFALLDRYSLSTEDIGIYAAHGYKDHVNHRFVFHPTLRHIITHTGGRVGREKSPIYSSTLRNECSSYVTTAMLEQEWVSFDIDSILDLKQELRNQTVDVVLNGPAEPMLDLVDDRCQIKVRSVAAISTSVTIDHSVVHFGLGFEQEITDALLKCAAQRKFKLTVLVRDDIARLCQIIADARFKQVLLEAMQANGELPVAWIPHLGLDWVADLLLPLLVNTVGPLYFRKADLDLEENGRLTLIRPAIDDTSEHRIRVFEINQAGVGRSGYYHPWLLEELVHAFNGVSMEAGD